MFWEDFKKLVFGPMLYRLDGLIGARLAPMLYALGLAAAVLWAADHLVTSFALSFTQGIWSIIEIVVYGGLWVIALRVTCEIVLVFFEARATLVMTLDRRRQPGSLLDEIGDAIHELAEDDDTDEDYITPATEPLPFLRQGHDDVDPIIAGTSRQGPRNARRGHAAEVDPGPGLASYAGALRSVPHCIFRVLG
jgi:hypothetical protein